MGRYAGGGAEIRNAAAGRRPGHWLLLEKARLERVGEQLHFMPEPNMLYEMGGWQDEIQDAWYVEFVLINEEREPAARLAEGRSRLAPVKTMLDLHFGSRLLGVPLTEELPGQGVLGYALYCFLGCLRPAIFDSRPRKRDESGSVSAEGGSKRSASVTWASSGLAATSPSTGGKAANGSWSFHTTQCSSVDPMKTALDSCPCTCRANDSARARCLRAACALPKRLAPPLLTRCATTAAAC